MPRCVPLKFLNLLMWARARPIGSHAQGSIAGVVKDASGAVLPGVTVEAASPALIEKIRSVVTDGTGQYKIIDLRPGAYTVTFTLPGFNTVKREGIELAGSFAAAVNADLKVGAVEETITVTGEAPTVDIQSVTQQRVMTKDVLDSIPSGRPHFNVTVLLPGVTTSAQDVGGTNSLQLTNISVSRRSHRRHARAGGRHLDANIELTGNSSNYLPDMGSTQELAVDYASGTADQAYGGAADQPDSARRRQPVHRIGVRHRRERQVPGRQLHRRSEEPRGLPTPNALNYSYDVNPSGGGPILKDKLWFYTSARWVGTNQYVGGRFFNLNAGDPNAWTYAPDTSRRAYDNISQQAVNGRSPGRPAPRTSSASSTISRGGAGAT